MARIGLPRALHFLQYYPLWKTFFDALGVEVVVSPATTREMVNAGAAVVADVTCLPVKVFAGHVCWLRDQGGVDFVLVPAIRSVEQDAFHCAKFQSLPDIIQATVPNCPPLLDIEIDWHRRKISPAQAFAKLAQRFSWNPARRQGAWAAACAADAAYRALMVREHLTYPEALARLGLALPEGGHRADAAVPDGALTVGVVGHPYCLYDDYVNHEIIRRLRGLGVRVLTSEMVAPEQTRRGVAQTTGQVRWFYEQAVSGAAGHFLSDPSVNGVIAVLAFTCGPDSAMVETITRRAHALGKSCLSLVLDEHGSAAGMVTRLEAFVDMLGRRTHSAPAEPPALPAASPIRQVIAEGQPPAVVQRRPVLGFPSMGTTVIPLRSVFRGVGAQLELGPPLSSRTISLGARHAPEFICTPYKYILGNMVEMLEAGADTLLYVDGPELCRNSTYTQLLGDVLHDLGYRFNFITTAILDDKVVGLARVLRRFNPALSWRDIVRAIRLGLGKMFTLDRLERQVQQLRPREWISGAADKVWQAGQQQVDDALDRDQLSAAERDVQAKLAQIPRDDTRRPVRIATTGEYYAVLEPFFNLDLERELGKLGAEVHRTLMMSHWARGMLILEALGFPRRPEIQKAAKPYLRWDVSGEGWVTVGQAVIHAQQGFDGLIETLPFTCIPEIAALNILPRVSREHQLPVLSFIYDEQTGRAGVRTRLEAFVDLLIRRRELREGATVARAAAKPPAPSPADPCAPCPLAPRCAGPAAAERPAGCARP